MNDNIDIFVNSEKQRISFTYDGEDFFRDNVCKDNVEDEINMAAHTIVYQEMNKKYGRNRWNTPDGFAEAIAMLPAIRLKLNIIYE